MKTPTAQQIKSAKRAARTILCHALFIYSMVGNDQIATVVYTYAGITLVVLAFVAASKISAWNYDRKEPQREAEHQARMEAFYAREEAKRAEQATTAYFNWDGPYTVAGQPR